MKVIITDHGFPDVSQEETLVREAGGTLSVAQWTTDAELLESCADADVLIVQWAPITGKIIARLKHCKLIVRYGIGVDNVDLKTAAEFGIPVCNIPDYCIDEVADHSLALALALARQVPQTDAKVRAGIWKITPPGAVTAFRDTVFATAGLGRIARAVLERARSFGFQLAAYDPFVDSSAFHTAGIQRLDSAQLFRNAGILSLHLPLSPETKHFLGKEQLATMLPQAVVVNTARGGLIDTVALAEALVSGTIAGAGIDVFETEPLPENHPLRSSPNTLLTSHTAWYSGGSIPLLQRKAAEEAVRVLRGETPRNVVNGVFRNR